jgi:hypothetical protein
MTIEKQIEHFGNELDKLIDRFRDEYDIPYAGVIAALEFKKLKMCFEVATNQIVPGALGDEGEEV